MSQDLDRELTTLLERIVDAEAVRLRQQRDAYEQSIVDSAKMMAPLIPSLKVLQNKSAEEAGICFSIPEHNTSCTVTIENGNTYENYALYASPSRNCLVLEYSYLERFGEYDSQAETFESADGAELIKRIVNGLGKQIAANRVAAERHG